VDFLNYVKEHGKDFFDAEEKYKGPDALEKYWDGILGGVPFNEKDAIGMVVRRAVRFENALMKISKMEGGETSFIASWVL